MSYFHYHIINNGIIREVEPPAYYSWLKTGLPLLDLPFEEKVIDSRIHSIETYFCGVTTEYIRLTPYHIEYSILQLELNDDGVFLIPIHTRHITLDTYDEMLIACELIKKDIEKVAHQ